jgi:hypothetical protein
MIRRFLCLAGCVAVLGCLATPVEAAPLEYLEFYVLNTNGGQPGLGTIERINNTGTTRTVVADISPSPFSSMTVWQGFATDGQYFYLLNSDAGDPGYSGDIDRINLDGTGRTNIADIAPSLYGGMPSWKGFAADGDHFYLLNTDGGGTFAGEIESLNKVAPIGPRVDVIDISGGGLPVNYSVIGHWQGFATDGEYFYLLNTGGGQPWKGRIERISMDGSGSRQLILDLQADTNPLFSDMENWRGFAVRVIPEPSTFLIWALGLLGLTWWGGRRRK